ncbi:2'-5' RNA ligase family protein [Corynebacterium pilosum]|uniref:2',5' RNA ligase family n=1 Tax=Corynebacterium pilosum TaxID=35756 RepID=A0A376CR36_9CORY|nr:2'-5' RNA ligase family protein [Corynebacterium pilosum]STC70108.1 2',5' RNA ligase family [Corynebacterium pilosum]
MSPDNILLRLPEDHDAYVREIFAKLEARGLPKQHQSPHITITFAKDMAPHVVERARELLPPLIPATLRRAGIVVFGTKSKQTVCWLLEASEELEAAARELSALNPEGRGARWVPHLTVGLRIPRGLVPEYIAALDDETSGHFKDIVGHRAVLWQPRFQKLTELS